METNILKEKSLKELEQLNIQLKYYASLDFVMYLLK